MGDLAPSSSGLGRRAFIPKILGSNPNGVTTLSVVFSELRLLNFCFSLFSSFVVFGSIDIENIDRNTTCI